MATIVASAAGGNWSSTTSWVGGVVPTSSDDVQLSSSSGQITITASTPCQSLDCTGYTNTLTHNTSVTLTIGGATGGPGNIALVFVSGMTYTVKATSSAITFITGSSSTQTITTAGKTLGSIKWQNTLATGTWKLLDGLNCPGATLSLSIANLDTNGQTVNAGTLQSLTVGTSSINFGATQMILTGTSTPALYFAAGAGILTIFPSTAIITISGAAAAVNSDVDLPGAKLIFNGGGATKLNSTKTGTPLSLGSLTCIGAASTKDTFSVLGPVTITNTLTITGNSPSNRILVQPNASVTSATISAAVVSLSNADFTNITAGGAAIPFSGTQLGDATGNVNFTFTTPSARYAVTAGNWSGNIWSTASGGAVGALTPLPQDTVYFDANSGSGSYSLDVPRLAKDVDFTGFSGSFQCTISPASVTSYGSVIFNPVMTMPTVSLIWILLGVNTHSIITNGSSLTFTLKLNGTGAYSLADNLYTSDTLAVFSGSFTTNSHTVTGVNAVEFTSPAVIGLGSSLITTTFFSNSASGSNTASCDVVIAPGGSALKYFVGGSNTYKSLSYTVAGSTGALQVNGSNTIGTLNFYDASAARSLTLEASTTTTVTTAFNVYGTASNPITINSTTAGTKATLSKPNGIVSCDYLTLKDSTASGGASWYAGAHSTIVSNVSGWQLATAPPIAGSFFQLFD